MLCLLLNLPNHPLEVKKLAIPRQGGEVQGLLLEVGAIYGSIIYMLA
jgi:hypothetical protein